MKGGRVAGVGYVIDEPIKTTQKSMRPGEEDKDVARVTFTILLDDKATETASLYGSIAEDSTVQQGDCVFFTLARVVDKTEALSLSPSASDTVHPVLPTIQCINKSVYDTYIEELHLETTTTTTLKTARVTLLQHRRQQVLVELNAILDELESIVL